MKNLKLKILIIGLTLMNSAWANSSVFYRVRQGDQLGEILYSLGFKSLWGETGSVHKMSDETQEVVADMQSFECADGSPVERELANVSINYFKRKNKLVISPYVKYFKTDITQTADGSTGEIISDSSLGAKVGWSKSVSEQTEIDLYLDAYNAKVQTPRGRTFDGSDSKAIIRAGFGFSRKLTENFKVNSSLSFGNELYFFFPTTETLRLDTIATFDLSFGLDAIFYKGANTLYGTRINASVMPSRETDEYKTKTSLGASGSLYMERILKNQKTFIGEAIVRKQLKDTDIFEQDFLDFRFSLGLTWDFE